MEAERIMAMTDAQMRRAPNANMDYVEAKVKAKANHTIDWLSSQSSEQELHSLIAVKRSRVLSAQKKERRAKVEKELLNRLHQQSQKKDAAEKRKLEKRVAEMGGMQLTEQEVAELCEPLGMSDRVGQAFVRDMLCTPNSVVGTMATSGN